MLYLAPYIGKGLWSDPFRPLAANGAWSAIDLRPDPARLDGYALLYLHTPSPDARLRALGTDPQDPLPRAVETAVGNVLGKTFGGQNRTIGDLVGELLLSPPAVKPWRTLLPSRLPNGSRAYEVYLNHARWFLQPVLAGGSLASDTFNRADENPIAAPWTEHDTAGNAFKIVSNTLRSDSAGASVDSWFYASAASTGDQFSEIQWVTLPSTQHAGPTVRMGASGLGNKNFYAATWESSGGPFLFKFVANSFTLLAMMSDSAAPSANSYTRLKVSGSTLTAYMNGATPATTQRGTTTDTSLTTGQPGVWMFDIDGIFDNWRGGDGSGAWSLPPFPRHAMDHLLVR